MTCQNCRSSIATGRYSYNLGAVRMLTVLCEPCAASLRSVGMNLRDGRATDRDLDRPAEDRRPVWLRNLRAKDFTGTVA